MSYETIMVEKREGGILVITLNRPERMNALTDRSYTELYSALDDAENDNESRVVVLTGAGKAFCAGADFSPEEDQRRGLSRASAAEVRHQLKVGPQKVTSKLYGLSKPTIAMVNGGAVGLGLDFALACDIRVGSRQSRFRVAFTRMGLVPGDGGAWLLPRVIGLPKALQITFTAELVEAEEACRLGLLNELADHEELEERTMALARKIAQGPPLAIGLDKVLLHNGMETDLATAMELAAFAQGICATSEDHREAVAAFQEKREPVFRGK